MYKGTVDTLLSFDPKSTPKVVQNPPRTDEISDYGFYVFGTENAMNTFLEKNEEAKRKEILNRQFKLNHKGEIL